MLRRSIIGRIVSKKTFKLLNCTDEEKLRFSIYQLMGDAEEMTEAKLMRDGPVTWEDFQREFDRKFSPTR